MHSGDFILTGLDFAVKESPTGRFDCAMGLNMVEVQAFRRIPGQVKKNAHLSMMTTFSIFKAF